MVRREQDTSPVSEPSQRREDGKTEPVSNIVAKATDAQKAASQTQRKLQSEAWDPHGKGQLWFALPSPQIPPGQEDGPRDGLYMFSHLKKGPAFGISLVILLPHVFTLLMAL